MAEQFDLEPLRRLQAVIDGARLHAPPRPSRYDPGHVFDLAITGVFPATRGRARLEVARFVGGGFAGQVYRARLTELELAGEPIDGLDVGGAYAVKILIPPSRFSRRFRDGLYWLAFQAPFSAQVHEAAARTGALWQKLIRRGAQLRFGDERCVRDVLATFFDPGLRSWGEINEWVEGRNWTFEIDEDIFRRGRLSADSAPHSREYLAKKDFMARLVGLFHDMGAPELARQYEWWTAKSQPNVLKRFDAGHGPGDGLAALDFRAGLALLPFLPMSPVDVALILRGLRRGRIAQFDRGDLGRLERYCRARPVNFRDLEPALAELRRVDREYRASQPDLTHHGVRLFTRRALRRSVRAGLVRGWRVKGLVDKEHAGTLGNATAAFVLFLLAGALPVVGKRLRRLWGDPVYARHVGACLTRFAYLRRTWAAGQAACLMDWYRSGRVGERGIRHFLRYPTNFWCIRIFPGLLPLPARLHRAVTDWQYAWQSMRDAVAYMVRFYRDEHFRVQWLTAEVEAGAKEGMLTPEERDHILSRVGDPFIRKYLKCVAVHVCTLPITQVISVLAAVYAMITLADTWEEAVAWGTGVLVSFQFLPISPGSFVRGTYVVYLMIKERNWRNYWVAVFVSYWHYVGYLGFPLQMVKEFPTLARFTGGRWATKMTRAVPVFGERGALLEHWVFDLFFNVPLSIRRWFEGAARAPWNCRQVALAFVVALLLQALVLPCLCPMGAADFTLALICDLAILLRVALAYFTRERGRGWIFYCALLYTSPLWVGLLSWAVLD